AHKRCRWLILSCVSMNMRHLTIVNGVGMNKVTDKHNVMQEEDRGIGKCMIDRSLWLVMN
ncbi:TPA: hypothetical protein ACGR7D_004689, partial [Escherichia coli]